MMNEQKIEPGLGEKYCPYDGVAYKDIPDYMPGYGCPVCKAVGRYHIPVSEHVDDLRRCDIEICATFSSLEWSCFGIKNMTKADLLRLKKFLVDIKNERKAKLGFINQAQSPDPGHPPDLDSES